MNSQLNVNSTQILAKAKLTPVNHQISVDDLRSKSVEVEVLTDDLLLLFGVNVLRGHAGLYRIS